MKLTKEEIQELPLINYTGPIEIISNKEEWQAVVREIKEEKILGFDTETKPNFIKGQSHLPALMQLATSKKVYIIQFFRMRLQKEMVEILSDENCLKVGVAIKDDMLALQKRGKFKALGYIDLATLAHKKGYEEGGLRTLCAALLKSRLSKNMRCSNWENVRLSPAQIQYAATDAWVSREIYLKLLEEK